MKSTRKEQPIAMITLIDMAMPSHVLKNYTNYLRHIQLEGYIP
jgi:hypothetical protein